MGRVKNGLAKIKKLFTVDPMTDRMFKEYSEQLGISQSQIFREVVVLGWSGFRKKYGMDDLTKPYDKLKEEDVVERAEHLLSEVAEREAKNPKGKRLAEAYMRDKLFGFKKRRNPLDKEGWEETGQ